MLLSILAIPAAMLLGFGVTAYLAYSDTKQGVHPPAMGGPKMQEPLLWKYRLLALPGVLGWFAVTTINSSWPTFVLGFPGALIGWLAFRRLDRRLTRHMG